MSTIRDFMMHDHRVCDERFSELENSAEKLGLEGAKALFEPFEHNFLHHFDMEEKVLFPAFNAVAGGGCNPTSVMIMEHEQMRQILGMLKSALEAGDKSRFLGLMDSFMMTVQQHNMKEEQILYPMTDEALALGRDSVIAEMQRL